jgi:hypothetical protein
MPKQPPPLPPIKVVAIDPGEVSAFARADILAFPITSPLALDPKARLLAPPDQEAPYGKFHLAVWGAWHGMAELVQVSSNLFKVRTHVVVEDYRVYPHKARQHIGSSVYTAREIGRIEWIAYTQKCTLSFQTASQAKQQWSNERIRQHYPDLYKRTGGKAHIRDALRHLFTFLENNQLHVFFRKEHAI